MGRRLPCLVICDSLAAVRVHVFIFLFFLSSGTIVFGQFRPLRPVPPPSGVLPPKSANPELDLPMLLKPKFLKGNTYRFITTTNITMEIPGQGFRSIEIEQQARFDTSPRKKKKKGVFLKGLTEHLVVKIQSIEKTTLYDSLIAKTRDTPLGKHLHSAMIRRVEIELNKDQRIVSFKEVGRVALPGPLPGMPEFGPDELKQLISTVPQGYSGGKVKPGDQWTLVGKRKVDQVGEIEFEMMYRHAGQVLQDQVSCIVIEFGGRVRSGVSDDVTDIEPADFQGDRIEGKMIYDPELKMVRVIEQSISMLIAMPTEDSAVAPAMVPVEQKVVTRLLHIVPLN